MYREDHLAYFRALIEGHDVVGWNPWWAENATELERSLPRAEFLRLKFGKVNYAAVILQQLGVSIDWSPLGRKQAAWAELHESVVDERGRPRPEIRAAGYGGAIGAYERGEIDEGTKRLRKYVRTLGGLDELEHAHALEDIEFDAEGFIQEGLRDAGVAILRVVGSHPSGNDLFDPPIQRAREKLHELGETAG